MRSVLLAAVVLLIASVSAQPGRTAGLSKAAAGGGDAKVVANGLKIETWHGVPDVELDPAKPGFGHIYMPDGTKWAVLEGASSSRSDLDRLHHPAWR